jgi:hypothetical protein
MEETEYRVLRGHLPVCRLFLFCFCRCLDNERSFDITFITEAGGRSPLACWCFADCSSSAAQASAAQAEQQDQMNGSMLIRFLELLAVVAFVAFASNASLHASNAIARSVATLLAMHLKTLELLSSVTRYLLTCDCQNR